MENWATLLASTDPRKYSDLNQLSGKNRSVAVALARDAIHRNHLYRGISLIRDGRVTSQHNSPMACAINVDHVNKACSATAATKAITTSQAICMAWRLAFSNTRNRAPRFGRGRCSRTGAVLERMLFFFPDVSASLETNCDQPASNAAEDAQVPEEDDLGRLSCRIVRLDEAERLFEP
ncbi:hypothetical protein [Rhizobium mongolense]|uniref:hypothetical protein n=1 Tax=Rhizobium mongolense TaxID=57676 RepID=UPI001113F421|nr:hypothetical protein [Rhizobium mongolense]